MVHRILSGCAMLLACGVGVQAATLTWDGGPSTAGVAGNATEWGAAANWRGDVAFSDGDSVLFTTVGNTTVAGVTSGVTTSGSTIMTMPGFVLAGAEVGQAITGTNIQPGTYISAIINSNTIELSQAATGTGSGSHVIANTGLPNPTTINLGASRIVDTLTFNNRTNSFALTLGSAADISSGYTLTLSNVNLTQAFTTGLTLASKVNLVGNSNGQSSWRDVGGGTSTISGAVSSTGLVAFVKSGTSGTLTLSGANTFSGSLLVEAGTLNLTGSNTYTGTTTASGGTLGLNFNSGTAAVPASNIINSGSSLVLGGVRGGGTLTVTGKAGSSVGQSFNGTTINAGASTLSINNSAAANTTRTVVNLGAITRNTGGTVNFVQPTGTGNTTPAADNGYTTSTANDASGILGGYATVGGAEWATNNGTNIVAYTGYTDQTGNVMAGAPGTNLRITNGTTGDITQSSGTTTVNTLRVNDNTARIVTVGAGNILRLGATGGILSTGTNGLTIGATGNAGTLTAGGTDNTAGEVIFHNSTAVTVNSVVADNGTGVVGLTKSGSGATTLNAVNTYTGTTTVNAGTLTLAASTNPLATSGAINVAGGTLVFGGAQTTTGAITLANGTISGGTLTNNGAALDARNGTITTALAGSAGINKTTGGTLTLSNTVANTFAGDTVVAEGNLVASSSVISIAGNLTVGSSGGGSAAAFTSSGTSNWAQGKTLTVYGNGTVNFGNNTQNLSATSTLNIIGGSVTGASISNNASTTINLTGGTLNGNFNGAAATYNVLASSAVSTIGINSTVGNQTFNVDDGAAATDLSYIGTLGGAFGITKNGAGLMAATSNSTYTGVTTINAGTLSVVTLANGGATSNLGSSTSAASNLLIRDGATLRYTGSGHSTDRLFTIGSNADGQAATVEASGTGAVNFTNTGSIAWGTAAQTRTLQLGGTSTANNTLSALLANNGSGVVSLTKQDAGRWILANSANSYTGATTINGGTLALGANNTLGAGSAVALNAGTLDLQTFSSLAASLSFNGGTTLKFNLGTPGNVTALLALTGNFDPGAGIGSHTLDFGNSGAAGTYNLVSFAGTVFSDAGNFTVINLGAGLTGELFLGANQLSLVVSAVPEPATYAAVFGAFALLGAVWHSRRRRA